MTRDELQAIQLYRQHLTAPSDMQIVARDLLGVQAQFLGNALHALRIRCEGFDENAARQTLVKNWTIRGTMHVFDPADLPLFLHEGRTHFLRPCDTMGDDELVSAERKRYFADVIVSSIRAGTDGRETLRLACRNAGMTEREEESVFNAWGGLLRALCESGTLCHQVSEKKAFMLCPPFAPMGKEEAELEKARRYFTRFGPATVHDAMYFFGCTQQRVKSWLDALPVESVSCEGRDCFYLGELTSNGVPDCVLLAGFDQLLLGYQKAESLYLPPEHLRGIFNRAGIVMPAVLLHGRVVGKWKHEKKRLLVTPFEPLPQQKHKTIEHAARRSFGEVQVIFEEK